ncbi:PR-1-like protein [Neocallimastix lanati (nom. inval.)]|nr:PR-1-like protein [Neocallimastix sp. JGI-2020a]
MKFRFSTLLTVAALLCSSANALSESDEHKLLRLHQKARSEMNASNMKSLSWSSHLASSAQKYANECRGMTHCKDKYGSKCDEPHENLASNSGTDNVETIFNQWYKEKSAFLHSGVVNHYKGGHAWGHFSQIVWAENTEVGCALAKCNNDGKYNLLVCKYARGNVIGEKVYEGDKSHDNEKQDNHEKHDSHEKHESHEEKKPAPRKTTSRTTSRTTTTTVRKTTEAKPTKAAIPSTKAPVQAPKNVGPSTKLPVPKPKPFNGKVVGANTATNSTVTGPTGPLAAKSTPVAPVVPVAPKKDAPVVPKKVAPVEEKKASEDKKDTEEKKVESKDEVKEKEIEVNKEAEDESKNNTGSIVTGVAVTGSVAGAAAAFALVKKNPRKYEDLKRSLSRSASSVKRGASVVTRRLTTKKTEAPTNYYATAPTSYNVNNYTYRSNLVDTIQV